MKRKGLIIRVDSYMFLDLEHSFGNDNEDTYQINIRLSKAF